MLHCLQETGLNFTMTANEGNLLPSCGIQRERSPTLFSMAKESIHLHPSIRPLAIPLFLDGHGGLEPIPADWARSRVHPGQAAGRSQG